jgi:hypothetical protein
MSYPVACAYTSWSDHTLLQVTIILVPLYLPYNKLGTVTYMCLPAVCSPIWDGKFLVSQSMHSYGYGYWAPWQRAILHSDTVCLSHQSYSPIYGGNWCHHLFLVLVDNWLSMSSLGTVDKLHHLLSISPENTKNFIAYRYTHPCCR